MTARARPLLTLRVGDRWRGGGWDLDRSARQGGKLLSDEAYDEGLGVTFEPQPARSTMTETDVIAARDVNM